MKIQSKKNYVIKWSKNLNNQVTMNKIWKNWINGTAINNNNSWRIKVLVWKKIEKTKTLQEVEQSNNYEQNLFKKRFKKMIVTKNANSKHMKIKKTYVYKMKQCSCKP
jgi:hypothetical protein